MTNWLVNGQRQGVSPADRGLAYGDGLFETIALRAGAWRFFDYHMERLLDGCRQLGIPAPAPAQFAEELELARDDAPEGSGKIIVTRGTGPRGYRPPAETTATRVIGVTAGVEPSAASWRDGIRVRFCRTPMSENAALAGLKTLNRLDNVLARAEWNAPDIAEGLMMTAAGHVVCGTMSNLFVVEAGALVTPALDSCGVRGVMRRVITDEAMRLDIPVRETRLDRSTVSAAQELFVSNSLHGIGPIIDLDGETRDIGVLTRRLMSALAERGVRECVA